jgi:hypothetical protein
MKRAGLLVLLLSLALACGGGGGGGSALPNIPPSVPDPVPDPDPVVEPRPEFTEELAFDETVPLDPSTHITPFIEVTVPIDAISVTIEGYVAGRTVLIGLEDLTGPAGRVYVADRTGGNYTYREESEIFSATIPNSDVEALGVFPGDYRFRLYVRSTTVDELRVRVILERRQGAVNELGQLPLNIWLGSGLPVKADTAATDTRLQEVIGEIFRLLNQSGVEITRGEIDYYDIANPGFDNLSVSELDQLCQATGGAVKTRLNLFFVEVVFGDGVVGASATISGPKRNGTRNSGVAVDYTGVSGFRDAKTIGAIAAHEIGHYLGLYHTVEQSGVHDIIEDTADCPPEGTNGQCGIEGGGLLMNWQYLGGALLTPGQGLVLRSHPIGGGND